jgi:Mg/Co/Ni transporter MgtE
MTNDPQDDRIARLLAALEELPFEEREAFIAGLPQDDRAEILRAEAEASEEVLPAVEELGGEG